MAQSMDKKYLKLPDEDMVLLCEWESCSIVAADIESFLSHLISEHLPTLHDNDLHCHWKDCEGFTENLPELRRHMLLHGFHTKIKFLGTNIQIHKKVPQCSLSAHSRNIIPELPDPLMCCWENCFVVYECPEHFYRHVDCHANYDSKREGSFMCLWQDCNRSFNDQFKVREHLRSHTQEKLVACPTCGGMFASRTKFLDHIQRQLPVNSDDEDGVYVCDYCSRKMKSERLLRDHIRHHVNHYKCPYCDMTCPTPSALQVHITYRHTQNKPHACQYCDYRCKSESDLRKHLESHSLIPSNKCPIENCEYSSRSPTCFTAHYRKVHEAKAPAKYSCHLCEKTFSRGNYLTKHLLNHHKFKWPSGHCRFRYCLNEDGIFRLQTVRYESLELSEAMMRENSELSEAMMRENSELSEAMLRESSENVDDPSSLIDAIDDRGKITSLTGATIIPNSHLSDSKPLPCEILNSLNSSTSQNPVLICVEEKDGVAYKTNCIVSASDAKPSVEEPVLIKIIDVGDPDTYIYDNQSLFLLNPNPTSNNNQSLSVQSVKLETRENVFLETAEVIPKCD